MNTPKTIGTMNGKWASLFKVCLAVIPLLCLLEAWQTTQIFMFQSHYRDSVRLQEDIDTNTRAIKHNADLIHSLPPPDWRDRIKQLEGDMRQNSIDHNDIKISLEQIKAKLGVVQMGGPVPMNVDSRES